MDKHTMDADNPYFMIVQIAHTDLVKTVTNVSISMAYMVNKGLFSSASINIQ